MRPTEDIKKLIKNMEDKTSAEMDKRILNDSLGTLEDSKTTTPIRKNIMKNNLTKFAAAAVIIIAVLIGIHYSGGSVDVSGVAWADVAELTVNVPSVKLRMTSDTSVLQGNEQIVNQSFRQDTTVYLSNKYGSRGDTYFNGELIQQRYTLFEQNAAYFISPREKSYSRVGLPESEPDEQSKKSDPREWVKEILSYEYKNLGRSNIDGIEVEGVEIQKSMTGGENGYTRLWVDIETNLPICIETESTIESLGNKMLVKIVFDNFQWDAQLDAGIFQPAILDDYIYINERNYAQLEGPREYTFSDGSTIILADGAEIQWLDSSNQRGFELLAGSVDITVAKGDREFIITTEYGDVKALGTQFNMELVDSTDSETRQDIRLLSVEVTEGSVEVSNDKGSKILNESQRLIVEKNAAPYDYQQDERLPIRLKERIIAAVSAMEAGDTRAYIQNYNIEYMYRLIKGQEQYDPSRFGGSQEDLERIRQAASQINNSEEMIDMFLATGGITKAQNKLYIRSVEINETGDHAIVSCVEREGPNRMTITTPQWHYFDSDWWQIDD